MGCFPLIHLTIGIAIARGDIPQPPNGAPEVPRMIGWMFIAIAAFIISLSWLMAAALVLGGRNLQARRRYTLCMVVAAVACLFMPLGTILGVFTLIVLNRPSVKELFQEGDFS